MLLGQAHGVGHQATAQRADFTNHGAGHGGGQRPAQWHQLEQRAVARTQGRKTQHEQQGGKHQRATRQATGQQGQGDDDQHRGEGVDAAPVVRDPAAKHTQCRPHEGRQHGELAGLHLAHAKLVVVVAGQKGGEADKTTKGDGVNDGEGPAVFFEQAGNVFAKTCVFVHVIGFFGKHQHHDHGDQQAHGGNAVHRLPAIGLGQHGGQQG